MIAHSKAFYGLFSEKICGLMNGNPNNFKILHVKALCKLLSCAPNSPKHLWPGLPLPSSYFFVPDINPKIPFFFSSYTIWVLFSFPAHFSFSGKTNFKTHIYVRLFRVDIFWCLGIRQVHIFWCLPYIYILKVF